METTEKSVSQSPAPQYLDEALHDLQGRFQHILLPPLEIRHLQAINWGHVGPRTYRNTTRQVSTRNPQHPLLEARGSRGICFFLSSIQKPTAPGSPKPKFSPCKQQEELRTQGSIFTAAFGRVFWNLSMPTAHHDNKHLSPALVHRKLGG